MEMLKEKVGTATEYIYLFIYLFMQYSVVQCVRASVCVRACVRVFFFTKFDLNVNTEESNMYMFHQSKVVT